MRERLQEYSVVSIITTVTVAVYFLQLIPSAGGVILDFFSLRPVTLLQGQIWRLLTYGFLHSPYGIWHVAFNMLGLWIFGRELEYIMGRKKFTFFYLFSIVLAGLFSLGNILYGAGNIPIIGASGAVYALLFVYALYYPNRQLLIFFVFPISIRAAVVFFTIFSILGMMQGLGGDGIAHIVHLGGFVAGYIFHKKGDMLLDISEGLQEGIRHPFSKKKRNPRFFEFERRGDFHKDYLEIDTILRKISKEGISSLTSEEWRVLKENSDKR
jgi:membrane associated rhomboid family serine protease